MRKVNFRLLIEPRLFVPRVHKKLHVIDGDILCFHLHPFSWKFSSKKSSSQKKVLNNGNYRELAFKGRWMINEDKCWQMGRMKSSHKRFTGSKARKQLLYIITWYFFKYTCKEQSHRRPQSDHCLDLSLDNSLTHLLPSSYLNGAALANSK